MKKIIKLFNYILIAAAALSIISLIMSPTLKVSVAYTVTPAQLAEALPKTDSSESEGVDVTEVIGEEGITLELSLSADPKFLLSCIGTDSTTAIEQNFIDPNAKNIAQSLRKPLSGIGRGMLKYMFTKFYISSYEKAIDEVKAEDDARSATEIRNQAGLTDKFLQRYAEDLLLATDKKGATVTSVNDISFENLVDGTSKFNNANVGVVLPVPDETRRADSHDLTKEMLDTIGMVQSDGESLYPLTLVMDAMLSELFREATKKEGDPEPELTIEQKAAQLNDVLIKFLKSMIPAGSYSTIAMIMKIAFFSLVAFAAIWALFLVFTLLRTFIAKVKIWTFTGPIFWILGLIQIILGVVLTGIISLALSSNILSSMGGAPTSEASDVINNLKITIATATFVPSIILLIMIPAMIVYAVLVHKYKSGIRSDSVETEN